MIKNLFKKKNYQSLTLKACSIRDITFQLAHQTEQCGALYILKTNVNLHYISFTFMPKAGSNDLYLSRSISGWPFFTAFVDRNRLIFLGQSLLSSVHS